MPGQSFLLRRDYTLYAYVCLRPLHCLRSCCILMLSVANAQLSCNCGHERNLRDTQATAIAGCVCVCACVWFSNFELHVLGVHSCHTHTRTWHGNCNCILHSETIRISIFRPATEILVAGAGNQPLIAQTLSLFYSSLSLSHLSPIFSPSPSFYLPCSGDTLPKLIFIIEFCAAIYEKKLNNCMAKPPQNP